MKVDFKIPDTLLTTENTKTIKGEKYGYKTFILYMSPHKQNGSNKNLCPKATEGCAAACLFTAGRGKFSTVKNARINRANYFINDRHFFMYQLSFEIAKAVKKYGTKNICVRLNGTTDVPFENIKMRDHANIFEMFPDIQFYDYTKVFSRLKKQLPSNYHLTFSRAETPENHIECEKALEMGFNVAAVFAVKKEDQLPDTYMGYPVVWGDDNDLTFLKPKGCIIGLKAKGRAIKDTSGFTINL